MISNGDDKEIQDHKIKPCPLGSNMPHIKYFKEKSYLLSLL